MTFLNTGSRPSSGESRLERYFDEHKTGRAVWKWRHYFEAYERHFARFVGEEVHVLEIGVFQGGSLDMWRDYFGPRCHVHGIDIEPACKAYEGDRIRITIGDQADPAFWSTLLADRPQIDVVIDDGGHLPHQQIATLEALLPHISPGGVYVCEDAHGAANEFHAYVHGLARNLHGWDIPDYSVARVRPNELQKMISSIHLYPFMVVIEALQSPRTELTAPQVGDTSGVTQAPAIGDEVGR